MIIELEYLSDADFLIKAAIGFGAVATNRFEQEISSFYQF
jgi:hypothetical protein